MTSTKERSVIPIESQACDPTDDFCTACEEGDDDLVASLLEQGAYVDGKDEERIPLVLAAQGGHASVLQLLLDAGANANAETKSGDTALRAATLLGDAESLQVLLGGGADPSHESCRGTALIAAAVEGDAPTCQLLLEGGAEVDYRTVGGNTALMAAVRGGHAAAVAALLRAGAAPLQENYAGKSGLDIAEGEKQHEIFRLLFTAQIKRAADTAIQTWEEHEAALTCAQTEEDAQALQNWEDEMKTLEEDGRADLETLQAEMQELQANFGNLKADDIEDALRLISRRSSKRSWT